MFKRALVFILAISICVMSTISVFATHDPDPKVIDPKIITETK